MSSVRAATVATAALVLAAAMAMGCSEDEGAGPADGGGMFSPDVASMDPDATTGDTGGPAPDGAGGDTSLPEDTGAEDGGGDVTVPDNTPPTFQQPAAVTLVQGESTTVDVNPLIGDAQDEDAALVVSWSPEHVALSDPGSHVIDIVAPTDWFGTEVIELVVTDTGGLTATTALTVKVEEWTQPPPECPDTVFSYTPDGPVSVVLVAGQFNGWNDDPATGDHLLDADGDGTWELTLELDPGTYEYRFVVDGNWITDPANPDQVENEFGEFNSLLTVEPCGDVPPPPECGEVTFSHTAPGASEVLLSGSFNGWPDSAAGADVMTDPDGDGTFEVTRALDPGTYQYKFIVDGTWIADPGNPNKADDGLGGFNSVITVPDCSGPGDLVLVSHDTAGGTFTATLQSAGGVPVAPGDVTVTVDWEPAPAGAVVGTPDGTGIAITLSLPEGIHDVRVEQGGEITLLKVYVGVSTDWRDVVIYFAMTDRFANGDPGNDAPVADVEWETNYQGGDFIGLKQKIEQGYFDDLGVGAIWISWPVDNPGGYEDGTKPAEHACGLNPATMATQAARYTAYHGYWPSQLSDVEEHFGTLADLQAMVVAAHGRGIRVMLDFTANHVHDSSPFYGDHQGDGYFNTPAEICQDVGWDNKPKTCWFTGYLPDLNYNNPGARQAVVDHALQWVKSTGADGFRFDAVKHLEMSFIQELRAATSAELELTGVDFYIVGETFTGDAGLIQSFIGPDKIHGQFDFPSNNSILQGFATQSLGLDAMDGQVRGYKSTYGGGELMSTFIGNHDIARFISHAAGDMACGIWDVVSNQAQGWLFKPGTPTDEDPYQRLRLAFTYAMTIPGVPLIYYGDEYGMPGAGDPDNRRFMQFGGELNAPQQGTLAFVQKLGQVRAAHPSLRRGGWTEPLWSEGDFLAFGRVLDEEKAIVLINRGYGAKSGSLTVGGAGLGDGTSLTDVLGDGGTKAVSGGQLSFDVPARSAQIYVTQ